MVELSLEEAMELKSNRKLPPWRPRLTLRACREKSRRSQDQRSSRAGTRGRNISRALRQSPAALADQEHFCSLHWEMGLGLCNSSRATAFQLHILSGEREHSVEKRYITRGHQSLQTQERLKVTTSMLAWWEVGPINICQRCPSEYG